ncbi:antigen-presenting glycoprotein CD1d-like isoform X2 [Lacerta agilis]|uniref:antigen-presenting glycoprotein CD1d-like isoform X2 n=1 Tax=Lacerta agilis TaxID=80427 RepID=UPI0014194F66|nr:antigen-presenting glycoprotein CD1d-like isoform X2 [Lacerta agilis]
MRRLQGCADGTGVEKTPGSTRFACRNSNRARGWRGRVLEFRCHSVCSSLRNRNLSCGRSETELLSLSARAPASSMHVRRGQKPTLLSPAWVLLLFWFLASSPCTASPASLPLPETLHAVRLLQTVVFHNASDTDIEFTSFLGDVEVVLLDTRTWKFKFLQPWSVSGLTSQEWDLLLKIIKGYFLGFVQTINKIVTFLKGSYPFVVQSLIFCESTSNGTTRGFYDAAVDGESVVTFSADNGSWVALKDDVVATSAEQILNNDKGTVATLQILLLGQCIRAHNTFLETGKEAVQRQVSPVIGVFTHKTPPAPDSLLLVCRVTGFYPRPINVSWLQDEKELPSQGFNSTEILPNHDLTYQIRSTLVIKSADQRSYACRVQHSSLGVKIIPWGRGNKAALIIGISVVALFIAGAVVVLICRQRRRRSYEDIHSSGRNPTS